MSPSTRRESPPRHCPVCGNDLSAYPYYQLVPSPLARRLLFLARLLLPVMAGAFLAQVFTGNFPSGPSVASGYLIIAYICTPSLLVYTIVALFVPKMRRVLCLRCSWFHDY